MRKIFLLSVFISALSFGQFTITESSKEWDKVGGYWNSVLLYKKGNDAKIRFQDIRSRKVDIMAPYKSQYQKNNDRIVDAIQDGNEGVKNGFYEFIFSASDDTLDKLYQLIDDHFKNKNKEMITLNFPEGNLYLDFNSKHAIYAVSIGIDKDGQQIFSMPFNLNGARKLFGKR